ncbi:hypothetical protein SO694_00055254 [Aureococcus anophagefferens]|uniref:Uncharacterized protein n=1 Tax=Aureococcus anophagefferens TaxID=44056 RepID=A0ABR1FXG0_AURAN
MRGDVLLLFIYICIASLCIAYLRYACDCTRVKDTPHRHRLRHGKSKPSAPLRRLDEAWDDATSWDDTTAAWGDYDAGGFDLDDLGSRLALALRRDARLLHDLLLRRAVPRAAARARAARDALGERVTTSATARRRARVVLRRLLRAPVARARRALVEHPLQLGPPALRRRGVPRRRAPPPPERHHHAERHHHGGGHHGGGHHDSGHHDSGGHHHV